MHLKNLLFCSINPNIMLLLQSSDAYSITYTHNSKSKCQHVKLRE